MTLPHSPFASLTQPQMGFLDDVFTNLGGMGVTACTAGGSANAITLTAITGQANTGTSSYQQDLLYGFVAAATNSGDTTVTVGALATLHVYKNTITGPALLSGSEIAINNFHLLAFDSALGGGLGGFHLANPASPLLGTLSAPTVQKFVAGSGTYTPPAGVLYITLILVGGGGGGGGSGSSGASTGGNAANSVFGASFTAQGGTGGGAGSAGGIGAGGSGGIIASIAAGSVGVSGSGGGTGVGGSTIAQAGGAAGISALGGGMPTGQVTAGNGVAGSANSGSGGSGGAGVSGVCFPGGGGGAGAYVLTNINNPVAVNFTVGAGGAGGTAGVGGNTGGAGAAGIIYVREFYQ